MTTRMTVTRIEGIQGVYSVHQPGQPAPTGVGVYHYLSGGWWSCEAHGPWRPWLPGQGVPCAHICGALALREEETP